jgi:hypothetical protein
VILLRRFDRAGVNRIRFIRDEHDRRQNNEQHSYLEWSTRSGNWRGAEGRQS